MADSSKLSDKILVDNSNKPNLEPSHLSNYHLYSTSYTALTQVIEAVQIFCDKYSLPRHQVFLVILLLFILAIASFATFFSWKYYSPIIQEFVVKEEIEKIRVKNLREKETQKKED